MSILQWKYSAWTYLQLPLQIWDASNVYLLMLSSWKVNIAGNPIGVIELQRLLGCISNWQFFLHPKLFLEQCEQESQAKRNLKKQPTNWASHQRLILCLCGPYCPYNRTTLHRTLSSRPPFAPHSTDGATLLTAQNFPPKQCACPCPCLPLGCHHIFKSQITCLLGIFVP